MTTISRGPGSNGSALPISSGAVALGVTHRRVVRRARRERERQRRDPRIELGRELLRELQPIVLLPERATKARRGAGATRPACRPAPRTRRGSRGCRRPRPRPGSPRTSRTRSHSRPCRTRRGLRERAPRRPSCRGPAPNALAATSHTVARASAARRVEPIARRRGDRQVPARRIRP